MTPYKLKIHPEAHQDELRIKAYIKFTLLNNKAADDFVNSIDLKYKKIINAPHVYPTDFFGRHNYHYAPVKRYIIVFRIDERTHTVHVIAIGHSRQKRSNIIKNK